MPGTRPKLILASASPRRLALLRQAGYEPDSVLAAGIDETARPGELPRGLAARLAAEKARAVARNCPDAWILAADTVVACGRRILPKPATADEARDCLALLSGRRHRVFGGVHVIDPAGRERARSVVTAVVFKRLAAGEIAAYAAGGEWRDKAGGYAIQGRAGALRAIPQRFLFQCRRPTLVRDGDASGRAGAASSGGVTRWARGC